MLKALAAFIIVIMMPLLVVVSTPATASGATSELCSENGSSLLGFPTWYKYLDPIYNAGAGECEITFDVNEDIGKVLLAVVEILLRVSGMIAVAFVMYGGFQYIFTQGDPEKAKSARKTIINAIIGIAIALVATGAVNFVGNAFV